MRLVDADAPLAQVTGEVIASLAEQQARRLGYSPDRTGQSRSLIALPRHDPRWLVDPEDPHSVRAASALYLPSRRRALGFLAGVRLVALAPGGRTVLRRLGGVPDPADQAAVRRLLIAAERVLGRQPESVAAFVGVEGPLRKLSAVLMDDSGRPVLFGKVASTPAAKAALEHEAESLALARTVVRSARTPAVARLEVDDDGAVLLLEPVAGSRFDNRAAPDARHLRLLAELHAVAEPADGAARETLVSRRLESVPSSSQAVDTLRKAVAETRGLWPLVRSTHLAHGDLTPWNCLDGDGSLGVVDWEMAGFRTAGWDAVHYLVQVESIAGTRPAAEAAERILASPFLAQAGALVTHSADLELPSAERWPALQLLCLIESAVDLLTTQPDISSRGIDVRAHAVAQLLGLTPPSASASA